MKRKIINFLKFFQFSKFRIRNWETSNSFNETHLFASKRHREWEIDLPPICLRYEFRSFSQCLRWIVAIHGQVDDKNYLAKTANVCFKHSQFGNVSNILCEKKQNKMDVYFPCHYFLIWRNFYAVSENFSTFICEAFPLSVSFYVTTLLTFIIFRYFWRGKQQRGKRRREIL